ncbi:MAG: arylsulfatase [Proteobacteria bacterium]|nr:arylsulfatase [Pseudomonadota bacterium]
MTGSRPNILVIFADQQRWDTLGCNGHPMDLTPELDRLARSGTRFVLPITNQPVCAPARATLLTGRYGTSHGVWRNNIGLAPGTPTLATRLSGAGYRTGYVGKWHLSPAELGRGAVPAEYRAGFRDWWEASNALEFTSQPFDTVMFDADGAEVRPRGYRVDACTDRTIEMIRHLGSADDPFLAMVSFLEPHHQNDVDEYVAPVGYAERYASPFVPEDLRPLPGSWGQHLPGYYGAIRSLDENVARLVATLDEIGKLDNTIIVYTADHGCHFKTRNREYKRSCHDSSIRVPLVIAGPGFDRRQVIHEPVSLVDLCPTLLDACGVDRDETIQGRSFLPLVARDADTCATWPEEVFIQISESGVARALRTERWAYGVLAIGLGGSQVPGSDDYVETHLYDTYADPHQHVNLIGRSGYDEVRLRLRGRLVARMVEAGETAPGIRDVVGSTSV